MALDTDFSSFEFGDIPVLEDPGNVVSDPTLNTITQSSGILSSISDSVSKYIDKFYPSASSQTKTSAPTGNANSNKKYSYMAIIFFIGLAYYLHTKKVI